MKDKLCFRTLKALLMSFLKFSQLNILFQACTILIISCLLLKIIDGQDFDWPIVLDPFPDADIIGPEPFPTPPPTPDCTYACQERVDEAMALISQVQNQLQNTNFTLLNRITTLESGNNNGYDSSLNKRVTDLELQLPANVSMLLAKINTDIDALRLLLINEIAVLRQDLEYKINNIPTGGGGGGDGTKAMEVYLNLTQRINNLENGKIQSLVQDSNLWRQNFKIINATFAKMKKSAKGNNVVLTG